MKKILIPQVKIYKPLIEEGQLLQSTNNNFYIDSFLHYPLLINSDGSLWKYGNLYLLSKLKSYNEPSSKTLDSIASDLKNFKEWCEKERIDYLSAPRKVLRPTYMYRSNLQQLLKDGKISVNTVKRRIGSVIGFYRYLIDVEHIQFKFPLWENGITSIVYKDKQGFSQSKQVNTTDVGKVVAVSNPDLFDEAIEDGGRLHPLTQDTQKVLMKTLKNIGNTEMTLGFLIALTTGARMQTVFTLRRKHFSKNSHEDDKEIRVQVGYGTHCDTKFQKSHTLIFPKWVYEKVKIYLSSPRAIKRLDKAKHIFDGYELQYIFLNRSGTPYYASSDDEYRKLYRDSPNGNAVRQFIHTTLKKELYKEGFKLDFSFHDLRASFGMNLLDKLMYMVETKELKLSHALMHVKERMGHSSLLTTERYLTFRNKNKIKEQAQDDYEQYLIELLNG